MPDSERKQQREHSDSREEGEMCRCLVGWLAGCNVRIVTRVRRGGGGGGRGEGGAVSDARVCAGVAGGGRGAETERDVVFRRRRERTGDVSFQDVCRKVC